MQSQYQTQKSSTQLSEITRQEYYPHSNPYGSPEPESIDFKPMKLVFNNDTNESISFNEFTPDFKRKIQFQHLNKDIQVKIAGDSILIYIIETAPGVACDCCDGSGRKK